MGNNTSPRFDACNLRLKEGLSGPGYEEEIQHAAERNAPVGFRASLYEWERVTAAAFERAQQSKGAA